MTSLILDTNAWAYATIAADVLTPTAQLAITAADTVFLCPVSLYEVIQKVRLGNWADMAPTVERIWDVIADQKLTLTSMTPEIFVTAGQMDWINRDPFDRLIAATARVMGLPVVTHDRAFDGAPGVGLIW